MEQKKRVSKDMTVFEALQIDGSIANILMNEGMHCIFCGAAIAETLEQAGQVHGIDSEGMNRIIAKINQYLAVKEDLDAKRDAILAEEDAEEDRDQ